VFVKARSYYGVFTYVVNTFLIAMHIVILRTSKSWWAQVGPLNTA